MQISLYFLIIFLFSLFSLIFLSTKQKIWCHCDICKTYLTSSWAKDFNNLCDWYTNLLRNSPTQTIRIHVLGNIITANPKNVEHILKTRFSNYPKGKSFSKILGDLLGNGIFNVDGDLWIFQRKIASLELGSFSIRSFAYDIFMMEMKLRLLPMLFSSADQKDGVLDLQEVFKRFSFDNICKFSFGLDPGCLELSFPFSQFANSFDLATKLSAERALAIFPVVWKIKRFFGIGSERKLKNAIHEINVIAMDVINQKRKLEVSNNQDLLSRFMDLINDDFYLRDIVISFILAGRDTMSSALSSLFWVLATRPDSVPKIRTESEKIMGPSQEFVTFEQIKEMHYLHAVVHESMRLYPPVQFDSKFARDNDILPDGTVVSKGTRVTYHPYAMGRMEQIWGLDCMEFKPERWLDNDGKFCPQNLFKYPVFQAGIRICLGKELAILGMKLVAVTVLSRFDFESVCSETDLKFEPGLTSMIKSGVKVLVRKRKEIEWEHASKFGGRGSNVS